MTVPTVLTGNRGGLFLYVCVTSSWDSWDSGNCLQSVVLIDCTLEMRRKRPNRRSGESFGLELHLQLRCGALQIPIVVALFGAGTLDYGRCFRTADRVQVVLEPAGGLVYGGH